MAKNDILKKLNETAQATDRREEYMSKKTYEKKPRALRRYEKYANMNDDKKSENQKYDKK